MARRLSTIKDADIIFVMEKGKIVEQGKYDDLMNRQSHFFKLAEGNYAGKEEA